MEFRRLGNSGLQVSAIGLGTNTFGTDVDEASAANVIGAFLDAGATFIDTSDSYPPFGKQGLSEEYIGRALKGARRGQAIVATKVASKVGDGPNDQGTSRQHIVEGVNANLRRLDMEHIDLLQIHRPDVNTPIEETMRALDDLVQAGKIRYIGCSNFTGWMVVEAAFASRQGGLAPFVSVQPEYNMLSRGIERELVPACLKYGLGVIPYYPLAGGFLTGKYQRGQDRPADSRGGRRPQQLNRWINEGNFDVIEKLQAFAQERNHTLAELAIAWLLHKPAVTTVICGASKPEQPVANIKAAEWKLTPAEVKELDELTAFATGPGARG